MKKSVLVVLSCLSAAGIAAAAPNTGSLSGDSMIVSDNLQRLSIGASMEGLTRDVETKDGRVSTIESFAYTAGLGLDLFRWLTVVGSAGATALDSFDLAAPTGTSYDKDLAWSAGVQLNIWDTEVREPEFMRGRFLVRSAWEYAEYNASIDGTDISWKESCVIIPVGYEIYGDEDVLGGVFSLLLSAGPIFSQLDGEVTSGSNVTEFSESSDTGVFASADVFVSQNLLVGANLQYFDSSSYSIYARLHF